MPRRAPSLGTIPIGGKLEFGQTDGKGRVFVNVEDKSEIVALDAKEMKVLAHWPIAPCEEPTGLALDAAHRRLFAACGNKLMAVVNTDTGKVVTTLPIGGGSDGAAFDPATQNAFSSNGEGTLTVVHESAPDKFEVVQTAEDAAQRPHDHARSEDRQPPAARGRARSGAGGHPRAAAATAHRGARQLRAGRGQPVRTALDVRHAYSVESLRSPGRA